MADEQFERRSETSQYVVNLDSGRVHRRTWDEASNEWRDFPRCNLDQIKRRRETGAREEVGLLLGRTRPKPCRRCYPGPTADELATNEAIPLEEAAHDPGSLVDEAEQKRIDSNT